MTDATELETQLFALWTKPPDGIDVLTLDGGRVSQIWMLADELQRLAQAGALAA